MPLNCIVFHFKHIQLLKITWNKLESKLLPSLISYLTSGVTGEHASFWPRSEGLFRRGVPFGLPELKRVGSDSVELCCMLVCFSICKSKNFLLNEAKTKILKLPTGEMASKRTALTVVWRSTALLWLLIAGWIRRGISPFGSKHGWWRAVDSTRQSGDSQTGRWAAELQIWQQHVWARNSDLWGDSKLTGQSSSSRGQCLGLQAGPRLAGGRAGDFAGEIAPAWHRGETELNYPLTTVSDIGEYWPGTMGPHTSVIRHFFFANV